MIDGFGVLEGGRGTVGAVLGFDVVATGLDVTVLTIGLGEAVDTLSGGLVDILLGVLVPFGPSVTVEFREGLFGKLTRL